MGLHSRPLSLLQLALLQASQRAPRQKGSNFGGNLLSGVDGWTEDAQSLPSRRVADAIADLVTRGYAHRHLVTRIGEATFADNGKMWGAFLSGEGARIKTGRRGQPRLNRRDSKVSLLGLVVRVAIARGEGGKVLNTRAKRIRRVLSQLNPKLAGETDIARAALEAKVESVRKAMNPQATPGHGWRKNTHYDLSFSDADVQDFFGKNSDTE